MNLAEQIVLGCVVLMLGVMALYAAVMFVGLTLTGAIPVGQAMAATYGFEGIAAYAVLWTVAFPVMLLAALVLGFIFDRMTRNIQFGTPQTTAFCRRLVEYRKHDEHIASSRQSGANQPERYPIGTQQRLNPLPCPAK